jgi:hypothetical protein
MKSLIVGATASREALGRMMDTVAGARSPRSCALPCCTLQARLQHQEVQNHQANNHHERQAR